MLISVVASDVPQKPMNVVIRPVVISSVVFKTYRPTNWEIVELADADDPSQVNPSLLLVIDNAQTFLVTPNNGDYLVRSARPSIYNCWHIQDSLNNIKKLMVLEILKNHLNNVDS